MGVQDGAYPMFGPRTVRKGGRVKFDGFWKFCPALSARVGDEVYCTATDIWGSAEINVYECIREPGGHHGRKTDRVSPGKWICKATTEQGND
jgi:hypothetical protein